ncbi:precorrin-6A reductase [uncultured Megasphaera sp.]|uniref:precorrin-6A reductase n=1 Tax=uncultured Megasphaera sp. TaxID=165188 RepID=UPI002628D6FD|nr:precorrin-6A reductase [uncultured Megasphaera sp.]
MTAVWIAGGTTEGRLLAEYAAGLPLTVYASVATDYGAALLPKANNIRVVRRRMDRQAMIAFLRAYHIRLAVDATHPYAAAVTDNIQAACREGRVPYCRVVRPCTEHGGVVTVDSMEGAAEMLSHTTGRIFLTTGSKDLDIFAAVPDYRERMYLRILPLPSSLERALSLGYDPAHMICMQGPFSADLNAAMFAQTRASYVVTKDSGQAGGYGEKEEGARRAGAVLIVVKRTAEKGSSLEDATKRLRQAACEEEMA